MDIQKPRKEKGKEKSAIAEWNVKIVERTRLYLPGFFSYNPPEVYFCADTPHPKSSSRA